MKDIFSREEQKLLAARTPGAYIDLSLKSRIPPGRKAAVTRYWLEKKGFTVDDIKRARNRNPYWKKRKMTGTAERNTARFEAHDYSEGLEMRWTDDRIVDFIQSNRKDRSGKYVYRDWELAKHFRCTIAAIQHMRRKYNMAVKILGSKPGSVTERKLLDHMRTGEDALRGQAKSMRKTSGRKKG
jgi:hypothetical protein